MTPKEHFTSPTNRLAMTGAAPLAYLHLSVDDVIEPLRSLFETRYASVWQHPTFTYLRNLHERFGFHALDDSSRYGPGGNHERYAAQHYAQVTAALLRIATPAAFDRAPRVHYYTGSIAAVRAWRDAPWGVRGLLSADDDRTEVYYLNASERASVATRGELFDGAERLRLFRTDVRLESCPDPVAVLAQLAVDRVGAHVFTHAQYLDDPTVNSRLEAVGAWMKSNGVPGGFPLDNG